MRKEHSKAQLELGRAHLRGTQAWIEAGKAILSVVAPQGAVRRSASPPFLLCSFCENFLTIQKTVWSIGWFAAGSTGLLA